MGEKGTSLGVLTVLIYSLWEKRRFVGRRLCWAAPTGVSEGLSA